MSEVWIANASPVIVLAKIGHLRLLSDQVTELILPQSVVSELLAGPANDPARLAVEGGWASRHSPTAIPSAVSSWRLGAGEAAVLALAMNHAPATAIVDDARARACAHALGIPVMGTLGVIARAKRRGLLLSAKEVIEKMSAVGVYLDTGLVRAVLEAAGEDI